MKRLQKPQKQSLVRLLPKLEGYLLNPVGFRSGYFGLHRRCQTIDPTHPTHQGHTKLNLG